MTEFKSIQNDLCQGLRASGIPKNLAYQIKDTFQKWFESSGSEWTVKRIKDLRQWYETSLTGKPVAPDWFRHDKAGLPLGVWKAVFKLPKAKALAVLSMDTVLYEKTLSDTQLEKFLHGIHGNGNQSKVPLSSLESLPLWRVRLPKAMPEMSLPTVFDMNKSVPIHDGHRTVRPSESKYSLGQALKALKVSWEEIPQVTFDFLVDQHLDWIPINVAGNAYQLELNKPHTSIVGRIGVIQEPELKARIVANPNRVVQSTLEPLKSIYMDVARHLPTDCIFDQEAGMQWVQAQLKSGVELAGSDLTSASDLLDLELCLDLVNNVFGFNQITGYSDYQDYFLAVSRSDWYMPAIGKTVRWEQGDPLGTGPSIGLLSLSNSCAAYVAMHHARRDGKLSGSITPNECFRVLGDDIIMRSEIEPYYKKVIELLGGEINHSKTLKSDKVAEFAGRVITPESVYRKKINYSEPNDNSFLSYVSQLGDQAKHWLRPNQRKVYNLFKEVPGVVVNGPWNQDSFGIPLHHRYQWYLEEVQPVLDRARPDTDLVSIEMLLLESKLQLDLVGDPLDMEVDIPWPLEESYLDSEVTKSFKSGGDPRLPGGQTLVDALSKHLGRIKPFSVWLEENYPSPSTSVEDDQVPMEVNEPISEDLKESFGQDEPAGVEFTLGDILDTVSQVANAIDAHGLTEANEPSVEPGIVTDPHTHVWDSDDIEW